MTTGGPITEPGGNLGRHMSITTLRVVEPGLSVVSIDGGRPEYLISQDWICEHPGQAHVGIPPEAWTIICPAACNRVALIEDLRAAITDAEWELAKHLASTTRLNIEAAINKVKTER